MGADVRKVHESTVVACRALPPEALGVAEAGRDQDQDCQQVHQTGSLISAKYESHTAEPWFWNKLQNLGAVRGDMGGMDDIGNMGDMSEKGVKKATGWHTLKTGITHSLSD